MYNSIMTPFGIAMHPIHITLIAAVLATALWRVLGVVLVSHLSSDHWMIKISTFTGYAVLSALMTCLMIYPDDVGLAQVPLMGRVGMLVVGFLVFQYTRKNIAWGMITGIAFFTFFL